MSCFYMHVAGCFFIYRLFILLLFVLSDKFDLIWFDVSNVDVTQAVSAGGNDKARDQYERHVPPCYRQPQSSDLQWVLSLCH